MRKFAAGLFKDPIDWRSHEPSRLETFSDAIFAFALTLTILSLEVPKSFKELLEILRGFVSFGICFILLFLIWNSQNKFFRFYNLRGGYITLLNACLLFVVLIYSYPLKFLFYFLFSSNSYVEGGHEHAMITSAEVSTLMTIYGLGFSVIYLLFFLMYRHAVAKAGDLKLTAHELIYTKTLAGENLINVFIGLTGIALAQLLPVGRAGNAGWAYAFIPVASRSWNWYMAKKRRKFTTH